MTNNTPKGGFRSENRFGFGKNWQRFLNVVDERRIQDAQAALLAKLETDDLAGLRFLDAGSGSGLMSLAALRSGAEVVSFDYDEHSVSCARELKQRFAPDDKSWTIMQGSVLDREYLNTLGEFDVAYSWGVLHHTGDMNLALDEIGRKVRDGGALFISIYNDQGGKSGRWKAFKKSFIRCPQWAQAGLCAIFLGYWETRLFFIRLMKGMNPLPFKYWNDPARRGMSPWHDTWDWLGGYPFEVATPEAIFNFYRARGFTLTGLTTCGGGHGCNEFVFRRTG